MDSIKLWHIENNISNESMIDMINKNVNDGGFSKGFWKGFFSGWMLAYIVFKLITGL
jgi:hypothetical protein